MGYVITGACIDVKDRSCVDECPVDCIYEAIDQLYINPSECIDCDACVEACPVDAIFPEDEVPERWHHDIRNNARFFAERPAASGGASESPFAPSEARGAKEAR